MQHFYTGSQGRHRRIYARWRTGGCGVGSVMSLALVLTLASVQARADEIVDAPRNHHAPLQVGPTAVAKPLPPKDVVPHPGLAPQAAIHVDAANSDVTDLAGPLGFAPVVTSQSFGFLVGTCLNFTFDQRGHLLAFCGVETSLGIGFEVTLLDPLSLSKLATYRLLDLTFAQAMALPLYLGYMATDNDGRVMTIGTDNIVRWIGATDVNTLEVTRTLDLASVVPLRRGAIASIMPDYAGNLFFMTLGALDANGGLLDSAVLGAVDARTGRIVTQELPGEALENGFAIGPDGVFVLTDHTLRAFTFSDGAIVETFSFPYQRATRRKLGTISWGSGSTPTLIGDHLLAFTDNTDEQVHLLVVDRRANPPNGRRVICNQPLFARGASANENSVIASQRSIIVQNWYGAPTALIGGSQRGLVPGLVRYDVRADDSGCEEVWTSTALATTATLKLSTQTGLLYGGMLDRTVTDLDAYYLGAVDFATGQEAFRIRLGVGDAANIGLSPTYIAPDGAILQPVRSGVYRVADGPHEPNDGGATTSSGCAASPSLPSGAATGLVMLITLCLLATQGKTHQPSRRRHWLGVSPVIRRNRSLKLDGVPQPTSNAMSDNLRV